MSSIVISGDTSGSVTLQAPAVSGATTLTLPAVSGTVLQSGTTVTEAQGGTGTTVGYYGFKNRIINGAMVIDQRNAGASINNATSGVYSVDRWKTYGAASAKFSVQQNAGSVTPPAGFVNYLGVTSLAATTPGSSDQYDIYQLIEGYNIADLAWGTSNAKTVTLSFWVRSSLTGTFGGVLKNTAATRSYPFSYTISSANTWEYKTITVPGPTDGVWETTTSTGIIVLFELGGGSSLLGSAGAWANANYVGVTGQTNIVATSGATFYITGVQLEKGATATSFDYRPFSVELALCQRYYTKSFATPNAPANSAVAAYEGVGTSFAGSYVGSNFIPFPVTMRAVPTMTYYSGANGTPSNGVWQIYDGGWLNAGSLNGNNLTVNGFQNSWYLASATVKGGYYISGHFTASAEL